VTAALKPFTAEEHRDALIRRRIKYAAEIGAMARLFQPFEAQDDEHAQSRILSASHAARCTAVHGVRVQADPTISVNEWPGRTSPATPPGRTA
jgi:hypothetical protein